MPSKKVDEIRAKLCMVVGSWWQETGQFLDDQGGLEVEDVIDTLMSTAKHWKKRRLSYKQKKAVFSEPKTLKPSN